MVIACIVAGGSGSRMGNIGIAKQFIEIDKKPILAITIQKFLFCKAVDAVVVATNKEYLEHTKSIIENSFGIENNIYIVEGGVSRFASLQNAVAKARTLSNSPQDIIISHDAVRPFVSEETIKMSIKSAKQTGAATAVIPVTDTILSSQDSKTAHQVPPREHLFAVQTPQTFLLQTYDKMLAKVTAQDKQTATDLSNLFVKSGIKVALIEGSVENIKITYPQDIPNLIKNK